MQRGTMATLVLACLPLGAAASDWPCWRGPDGSGVSAEKNLPQHWSGSENVRWKVPLEGAGVSAPVVWQDRVFLTASDGRLSDRLHVYCFHRDDGRILWHARFFGSAQPEGQFPPGGMAVPTPATDGRRLYALFGTGDLVCLDFDGKPVWVRSLAQEYGPFRNRWGMGASPLLVGELLVVQVDHWGQSYLLGLEAATGANRWRTERDAAVNWSSPIVARVNGKSQIITTGTHRVRGYDPDGGTELWRVRGMQQQCIPSPIVCGNRVYAVSGRSGYTLAIRLDGSHGDLTQSHIIWKKTRGSSYVTSPVCYQGHYYLVREDGLGTCLDAATGKEVWQERMGGEYRASLLAGDGKIYFTSVQGVVSVVKAGPEFQLLAKNDLGENIVASPAVSESQLFIRGAGHLFCIGARAARGSR
jgi:outer membrane protein assembly factor BamB